MKTWHTIKRAVALSLLVTVVSVGSAGCGRKAVTGAPAATEPGSTAPGQGGNQQPVGSGSVTGRVVDARTNSPVASAQVSAGTDSATTSASGSFVLNNVPAGMQMISVNAQGYDPNSISISVQPNTTNDAGNVTLTKGTGFGGGIGQGSTAPNSATGSFDVTHGLFKSKWSPVGVAAFGGNVYVAATGKGLLTSDGGVLIFSNAGKSVESETMSKTIKGVSVANDGTVFAVDDKYVYSGKLGKGFLGIGTSLKMSKKNAGLSGATDVAADGSGSVYVAAGGGISKFPFDLSTISSLTGTNQGGAAFSATSGVGADSQGNLYFISGNKIEKVDIKGDPVWTIGGTGGADASALAAPVDVAVDSVNQYVYVLDGGAIKRFDGNGGFLVSTPGSFSRAASIACDESGNVYVADAGANKVFIFGAAPRM